MTLVQKFTEKYGVNPIKLVEDANLKNFGFAKKAGINQLLKVFIGDTNPNIEVNNGFKKDLVESFAEAKEKFPDNQKASVETGTKFEVPNQMSGIPKSKGTLENFKDIVGTDELRPIMMGVYVSEDGFIVGTDAHKLVKQKNNGLLSQTDYAGKIIDLTKYIKSKGKLIDFVDGVYPKYDAVIPRDTPYEDRALSTYAFYNYVKSALEIKRLVDAEIFNINFNLMTETSGETKMFSFGYHILFDALNFAMLNGWDVFTLRYSEPNRAVVFDFGGDNIILVMPIIDSYSSIASTGSTGTMPLTTEEVEEKYRLGLTNQKASKPKASKPVRPSAPVSSEPFKKFEGDYDEDDTTYVLRKDIESITLTNGEVLGKNDVVQGIWRVKKKMAHGGALDGELKSFQVKVFVSPNPQTPVEETVVLKPTKSLATLYVEDYLEPNWISKYGDKYLGFEILTQKMAHGGSMYADGGNMFEKPIAMYREVSGKTRNLPQSTEVYESEINRFIDYVHDFYEEEGYSKAEVKSAVNKYLADLGNQDTYGGGDSIDREKVYKYLEKDSLEKSFKSGLITQGEYEQLKSQKETKYAHGGSMYAGGGTLLSKIKVGNIIPTSVGNFEIIELQENTALTSLNTYDGGFSYFKVKDENGKIKYIKISRENQPKMYLNDGALYNSSWENAKQIFAHGGSMSSSHEAGDKVTFKSVMGGTKTGLIVSKLGEDGFRIKTEDGFATVKKSAIV